MGVVGRLDILHFTLLFMAGPGKRCRIIEGKLEGIFEGAFFSLSFHSLES